MHDCSFFQDFYKSNISKIFWRILGKSGCYPEKVFAQFPPKIYFPRLQYLSGTNRFLHPTLDLCTLQTRDLANKTFVKTCVRYEIVWTQPKPLFQMFIFENHILINLILFYHKNAINCCRQLEVVVEGGYYRHSRVVIGFCHSNRLASPTSDWGKTKSIKKFFFAPLFAFGF